MNIRWDADKYTKDFSFVHQYGNGVAELIDGEMDGTLIDLGCGNGALTKILQNKGFQAAGMDSSEELLDTARQQYPDITFIQADATDFSVGEAVDVIFSNAVFHWIEKEKQMDMLNCVYKALKEKGQFVFEFGGHGNNALIHGVLGDVFSEHGYEYKMPFYFPTIGEYAALVERAGFQVKYAVLFDRPTELKGNDGLKEWIHMFVKAPFAGVDDLEREGIICQAVERLRDVLYREGRWYADYVRIRMKAVKE
ncbi:MAG: methyltransferase domain-containing protein [Butyrivibrio sp.]|nr:methyltransferase domain-containing protein [Butyrivibrio sp.]